MRWRTAREMTDPAIGEHYSRGDNPLLTILGYCSSVAASVSLCGSAEHHRIADNAHRRCVQVVAGVRSIT